MCGPARPQILTRYMNRERIGIRVRARSRFGEVKRETNSHVPAISDNMVDWYAKKQIGTRKYLRVSDGIRGKSIVAVGRFRVFWNRICVPIGIRSAADYHTLRN